MKRYSQSFTRVVHLLLVVALLLTFAAPAFAEGEPTPDKTNQFSEFSRLHDPEMSALLEKYSQLAAEQSLSAKELADLIAQDKNEKAKWIGIKETFSSEAVDHDKFGSLSFSESPLPTSLNLCIQPIWQSAGKVIWNFSNRTVD